MARVEDIWGADCEEFRPERWLDEVGAFRPESPFKYPVFHAGPRMCLGKEMADIQMKSIVASVLERFSLQYAGGEGHPGLVLSVTLRMKGGLPMQRRRQHRSGFVAGRRGEDGSIACDREGIRRWRQRGRRRRALGKAAMTTVVTATMAVTLTMEFSSSSTSLFLLLSILPLLYFLCQRHDPKKQPHAHGLKSYPVVGTLPHFAKNKDRFLEFITEIMKRSPTHTLSFKALGLTGGVITANPANVEYTLKTNFGNYPKGELAVSMLVDFLGHGIFNSDGEQWQWQRKAASYDDESLRDVVTNFLIAGRDSTSSALTWFFWLVSSRPDVEDKIVHEIRAVRSASSSGGTSSATFSFDELRDMHYLHAAITESMRLYPPVHLDTHSCKEDDFLPDGTSVGKGWLVTYCAYAMGRVEDIWGADCEEFRPERWLDEAGAFRPESPFKYPIFHAGPRTCLGKEMAYIQMKSIVACVLEQFSLRYAGGEGHPGFVLWSTLRMEGGLPMQHLRQSQLTSRKAKAPNHLTVAMELSPISASLLLILILLAFLPLLYFLYMHQDPKKKPRIHGLKSYPVVGTLPHIIKNKHRFLKWSTEIMKRSPTNTMSYKALGLTGGVITANPANVEHILKTNFDNYPKGKLTVSILEDFLGHGIFNSDGEQWLWQRKAASYEFNKRSLRNFVVDTVRFEIVKRLLPLLEKAGLDGRTLDLQDVLERFAFDNICRVAFGEDPACLTKERMAAPQSAEFMRAFNDAQNAILARFNSPAKSLWRVKKLFNMEPERRMREALATIHGFAELIVRERRERGEAGLARGDDFLSRFAASGEHSDESLRDVATNFVLAGRDTTSSALTWFFWIVSGRPDVEDRVVREIRAVRASSGSTDATFSFDELREMHYLHAAITESMRLYPPVAIDTHSCKEDDFLPDGTFVGKGWLVTYCAYAMARVEDIWGTDCEEFRPERWLDEAGVFRPESSFKYPVFHGGPRMCLGKEIAYIQMKSIVSCVFDRFTLRYTGGEGHPGLVTSLALRMEGGLPMQVLLTNRGQAVSC
uniref:Cytochrome P450 n=1 Tax=Oryza glumipatula TaxID=40148 RepID=A0A0D9YG95_9ORYZ